MLYSNACDLCAVYNATSATGEASTGPIFSVAEQYVRYHTVQLNGNEISPLNPDKNCSSITHFVPGYNFHPRFGVSLNVPLVINQFKRSDLRYSTTAPPVFYTEKGRECGLGDIALIGRFAAVQKVEMDYAFIVTLLAGVKFPTGDTDRISEEVEQSRIFDSLLPPNTPHDPLSHSISSVHPHDLSPGSGSYDGIFGATMNARYGRYFFNMQFQYYLRTEGEDTFEYGDTLALSGGPGAYLLLGKKHTLSIQANLVYERDEQDELLGRVSNRTGSTAWYLGPQIVFTAGFGFSANVGMDIPLEIDARGFQNVADYRIHGGFTFAF